MSEPGQTAAAGVGQKSTADAERGGRADAAATPAPNSGNLPGLVMAAGGLLTGIVAGASLLALPSSLGAGAELHSVAKTHLEDAIASMGGRAPAAVIEEARQCKAPLAVLTVSADGAAGAIRVRSGSYLSPAIQLNTAPQRIAIPFPAPYATGKGVLSVEGLGQGVYVWLSPGQYYTKLEGPAAINVWWTPKSPC
jgi:hypothetical protein